MPALSAAQQVTAAGQTLSFTPPTSGATTTDKIASAVVFNRSGFDLLILAPGVGFVAAWGQANVSFGTPLLSYGQ
ncbi:MAG TPA: hypothetical protein VKU91_01435, partial [Acidimicrobiales bacterium]|nr:hypothetical protein [Acidimicrobiales bacterium]